MPVRVQGDHRVPQLPWLSLTCLGWEVATGGVLSSLFPSQGPHPHAHPHGRGATPGPAAGHPGHPPSCHPWVSACFLGVGAGFLVGTQPSPRADAVATAHTGVETRLGTRVSDGRLHPCTYLQESPLSRGAQSFRLMSTRPGEAWSCTAELLCSHWAFKRSGLLPSPQTLRRSSGTHRTGRGRVPGGLSPMSTLPKGIAPCSEHRRG